MEYVTLQVWQLGSSTPNFTLEGHEKGVNCVDYYHGGDKPYLISGADDCLVKIWDFQNIDMCTNLGRTQIEYFYRLHFHLVTVNGVVMHVFVGLANIGKESIELYLKRY